METIIRKIVAAEVKKQLATLTAALSKKQAARRKSVKAYVKAAPAVDEKEWKFRDIENLRFLSGLNRFQFAIALGVSPCSYYIWKRTAGIVGLSQRTLTALDNLLQEVGNKN
jgi:DNA-binding transcriptional regulator YiaG